MSNLRILRPMVLAAAVAASAVIPLPRAEALRDQQQYNCGGVGIVVGFSASGTDNAVLNGRSGETGHSLCTAVMLSGWEQCYTGYVGYYNEKWSTSGLVDVQACGYPNVIVSSHSHDGCEYGACAGEFYTVVAEY